MASHDSISYLGLGAMGSALAQSAVKAGLHTVVWNRNKDRDTVKAVVQDGAKLVDDPGSALKASQLIVLCLLDYASVYEVLKSVDGIESILKGKTIVNLTTSNAEEGPVMKTWMVDQGVEEYLEGAIMNLPQHVGTPDALTFISGGSAESFSKVEPTLKTIGALQYLGEDPSAAALYDGAMLSGMYGMFAGCMTSIALLSRVKPSKPGATRNPTAESVKQNLIPTLQLCMEWVTKAAECFDEEDWKGYFATNEVNYHGLANTMKSCDSKGVDTRCLQGMLSLFERATVKEGKGDGGLGLLATYLLDPK